jgi:hypothetical protein
MKTYLFAVALLAPVFPLACGGPADSAATARVDPESKVQTLPVGLPPPAPIDWEVTCTISGGTVCSSGCVCTLTDSQNCGGCGNECFFTFVCVDGRCVSPLSEPESACAQCLMNNPVDACPMCSKCTQQ